MIKFSTALILAVIIFLLCVLIVGTCIMWLWNWLMPEIFGLPELTWLQSIGLYTLVQLFFQSHINFNSNNKIDFKTDSKTI